MQIAEDRISCQRAQEPITPLKEIRLGIPILHSAIVITVTAYPQEGAAEARNNLLTIGRVAVHPLEFQLLCVLQALLDRGQHALRHHVQIREGTTNFAA